MLGKQVGSTFWLKLRGDCNFKIKKSLLNVFSKKIRLLRQFEYIISKLGRYVNYMNSNLSRAYYCSKYHKKQLLFVQKCQTYWLDQLLHNSRSYFVQLRWNSELRSKLFLSLRWCRRKNGHLLRFLV